MGATGVAAGPSATEGVAVDFVGEVDGARRVDEAGRIDSATLTVSEEVSQVTTGERVRRMGGRAYPRGQARGSSLGGTYGPSTLKEVATPMQCFEVSVLDVPE